MLFQLDLVDQLAESLFLFRGELGAVVILGELSSKLSHDNNHVKAELVRQHFRKLFTELFDRQSDNDCSEELEQLFHLVGLDSPDDSGEVIARFLENDPCSRDISVGDLTMHPFGEELNAKLCLGNCHGAASSFGVECQIILSQINDMSIADI